MELESLEVEEFDMKLERMRLESTAEVGKSLTKLSNFSETSEETFQFQTFQVKTFQIHDLSNLTVLQNVSQTGIPSSSPEFSVT